MGNLHEIHIPPDADEPTDWAVRREFGMRYDSYRECQLRDAGVCEIRAPRSVAAFFCNDPEAQWVADMEEQFSMKVKEQR